ncbi:MAG: hypothetical protein KGY75_10865, partial [Candidatus Cloacimonetes bacterium]|nr:hypothetical protein [Candidatus Cloacimonadota bacterium]
MKKYILFVILLLCSIFFSFFLYADDFTYEKINDFGFAQSFMSNGDCYIEEPFMYALTLHGLEIYELDQQNNIQKISLVPLRATYDLKIKGTYAYISDITPTKSEQSPSHLYQIDISDPYDPYINKTIEFTEDLWIGIGSMQIFNEQLYFFLTDGVGIDENCVYSLPELNFLGNLPTSIYLRRVNDSLAIDAYTWSIYNATDLMNVQLLGDVDNPGYSPINIQTINDTMIAISAQEDVHLWDISNPGIWENVSDFSPQETLISSDNIVVSGDYMILICFGYLELVDIINPYDPQHMDMQQTCANNIVTNNRGVTVLNNKLFLFTFEDGILKYSINNNIMEYDGNYFEYPKYYSSHIYSHYLFLQTWRYGIYCFDISNPENPVQVQTSLQNPDFWGMIGQGNLIIVKTINDKYKIFDISNPTTPLLNNTIDINCSISTIEFDEFVLDNIYIFCFNPAQIKKYDISEPGSTELLFNYSPNINGSSLFVKDDYGYISEETSNSYNLYILEGLAENDPYISNTINNFIQNCFWYFLYSCHDYLVTGMYPVRFFNLDIPLNPEFEFELDIPDFTGRIYSYYNLAFAGDDIDLYIYDIASNSKDILPNKDVIKLYTYLEDVEFYSTGTCDYLFAIDYSTIEVFEFSY